MSNDLKPVTPEAVRRLAEAAERRRERYPACGGLRQSDGRQALKRIAGLEEQVRLLQAEVEALRAEIRGLGGVA